MSNNRSLQDNVTMQPDSAEARWIMYKRRLFLAVGLVAFLIILASFVSATLGVLLLLFLCVLIALGVRGISDWLTKHTPLSDQITLVVTVAIIAASMVGLVLLVGSRLAGEFSVLSGTLQEALSNLEEQVQQSDLGRQLIQQLPSTAEFGQQIFDGGGAVFSRVSGIFSSTLGLFSSVLLVIFISLFLAAQPKVYRDNFLRLIPKGRRDRIRQMLSVVANALQKWLLTRFISILVIAVLTTSGLLLFNMPLALSLGILAALAGIIPTFGPILALIPAILVAFTVSPQQVVFVMLLYIGIQMVDNYLITPLVQKQMLSLPPAYIIVTQLLFGIIAGPFGLVLAAPMAIVLVIIIRMLYVEDVLGDIEETVET